MTDPRRRTRVVADVDPELKRRADLLARFSAQGTIGSYVTEALRERVDRDWPALAPVIQVMEQRQEEMEQSRE